MSVAETHTDRQILQQHTLHFHSLHHAAKMTQICRHSDYSDAWAIFTSLLAALARCWIWSLELENAECSGGKNCKKNHSPIHTLVAL